MTRILTLITRFVAPLLSAQTVGSGLDGTNNNRAAFSKNAVFKRIAATAMTIEGATHIGPSSVVPGAIMRDN